MTTSTGNWECTNCDQNLQESRMRVPSLRHAKPTRTSGLTSGNAGIGLTAALYSLLYPISPLCFVSASELTTQDLLAMVGQTFCAGVFTRWVCEENFHRCYVFIVVCCFSDFPTPRAWMVPCDFFYPAEKITSVDNAGARLSLIWIS
jgi:hypothetical protein